MTTIRLNLRNNAITQYSGWDFNSFCMFQGKPLASGPDGIFQLETGNVDAYLTTIDEREVSAWFELPVSNLGFTETKRGRRLLITGEMDGEMQVTATTFSREEASEIYSIVPRNCDLVQHTLQVMLSHKQQAEHWAFVFGNVEGSDFSIDAVDGIFIPVSRRLGM